LAIQYEEALTKIGEQKDELYKQQLRLDNQEQLLAQYKNLIEAVGHDQQIREKESNIDQKINGVGGLEVVEYLNELMQDEEDMHPDTKLAFNESDIILAKPFDFYGTSLMLNADD
jgi:hypothetical protein